MLIGWLHWGWQDGKTKNQTDLLFEWYVDIFEGNITQVVSQEDPDRFYWPTSPTSQAPGNYSFGDIH